MRARSAGLSRISGRLSRPPSALRVAACNTRIVPPHLMILCACEPAGLRRCESQYIAAAGVALLAQAQVQAEIPCAGPSVSPAHRSPQVCLCARAARSPRALASVSRRRRRCRPCVRVHLYICISEYLYLSDIHPEHAEKSQMFRLNINQLTREYLFQHLVRTLVDSPRPLSNWAPHSHSGLLCAA